MESAMVLVNGCEWSVEEFICLNKMGIRTDKMTRVGYEPVTSD